MPTTDNVFKSSFYTAACVLGNTHLSNPTAWPLTDGRSYSRLLAFECARILQRLGCDVRVFDPTDLPVKDDTRQDHPKVQELRQLSTWSNGHVWVSPEQHGNLVYIIAYYR